MYEELGCAFDIVRKGLDEQDLMKFYFVSFGLKMWEISNFKWIVSLQIQIKIKKPGFGRENQFENVITLSKLDIGSRV